MLDLNLAASPAGRVPTYDPETDWGEDERVNAVEPASDIARSPAIAATVYPFPIAPLLEVPRRSKFEVEDFDTLEPPAMVWRVKGLWPSSGVCVVAGPSGSGKSFWVLDAGARVCRGLQVVGRKSNTCGVVYIASEDGAGVKLRIKGLRLAVGLLGHRFDFVGQAPDLTDVDDIDDLRGTLIEASARMKCHGHELGIVFIDTLSASIPGADENTAKDMSPVLAALQTLAQDLGLLVVLVAHTGKDETRGVRGWSGLRANADGLILFEEGNAEGVRVGTLTKVKNGSAGDKFAFTLRQVPLGHDADGDEINTCVVDEADVPVTNAPVKRLNGNARIVAQALGYLIDNSVTHPALNMPGVKPGKRSVAMEEWKARAGEMGLFVQGDTPANRRQKWHRAVVACRDAGMVRIEGEWAIPLQRDEL